MAKQNGQIILILVLVMTVALAIGISVIQRSLLDISSSSKVEQSSRAFSAAEAGLERALRQNFTSDSSFQVADLSNATAGVDIKANLPAANQSLEYPPISKEEIAQVWLADPVTLIKYYDQPWLEIAWGMPNIQNAQERPAIEVTVIYSVAGAYQSKKFYFDSNSGRASTNGFQDVSANCSNSLPTISTTMGPNRVFYCRNSLSLSGITPTLILLRARILYSSTSQAFAVLPWGGSCGTNACSLPPQARIVTSTGTAGETQRKVQVFKLDKVVPFYFDYAIFSAGEITK
ncbi:hypothetical protein HY387_00845 [Candidatus Daviesbacteria bacterium]|nr:hypothetical protein [Candidatus Daviesbacteria bacterium]